MSVATASEERFRGVETFRGMAILEVVLHHTTGRFLSELVQGSLAWGVVAMVNRTLHFAVPAFLLMTAFVLMRAVLRDWNAGRYARNRLLRAVWPYLLWSGFYLLYRWWAYDVVPDIDRADDILFWGKAYYHLYFLAVAIQLYLIIPFALPIMRLKPPFWSVLMAIVFITLTVYGVNRWVYRLPYPGSFVLWYTPTILFGFWLASQSNRLEGILRRGWLWAGLVAFVGLVFYLPLALAVLQKQPANTFLYQLSNWLYTGGISVFLLWVAYRLSQLSSKGVALINLLGRYSLQIYLLHPLLLSELTRWGMNELLSVRYNLPLFFTVALGVSALVAWLVARWRPLSLGLFGRA